MAGSGLTEQTQKKLFSISDEDDLASQLYDIFHEMVTNMAKNDLVWKEQLEQLFTLFQSRLDFLCRACGRATVKILEMHPPENTVVLNNVANFVKVLIKNELVFFLHLKYSDDQDADSSTALLHSICKYILETISNHDSVSPKRIALAVEILLQNHEIFKLKNQQMLHQLFSATSLLVIKAINEELRQEALRTLVCIAMTTSITKEFVFSKQWLKVIANSNESIPLPVARSRFSAEKKVRDNAVVSKTVVNDEKAVSDTKKRTLSVANKKASDTNKQNCTEEAAELARKTVRTGPEKLKESRDAQQLLCSTTESQFKRIKVKRRLIKVPRKMPEIQAFRDGGLGSFRNRMNLSRNLVKVKTVKTEKFSGQIPIIDQHLIDHKKAIGTYESNTESGESDECEESDF